MANIYCHAQVNHGAQLLKNVRDDLANVVLVCEGKKKQTNHERSLLSDLAKGILPSSWNQYTVPRGLTVIQWVSDFSERIKQLQKISANVGQEGTKELKVLTLSGKKTLNPCVTQMKKKICSRSYQGQNFGAKLLRKETVHTL